jgi:hypothetical protein
MSLLSLITKSGGQAIRVWQSSDPSEVAAAAAFYSRGFRWYGHIYKVDGQNMVENRTGLSKRWKVMAMGRIIVSYDTEAEADTFIRKVHDQINTVVGANTIKRMADI